MPRHLTELDDRVTGRLLARIGRLDGVPREVLHRIGILLASTPGSEAAAHSLERFWRDNPGSFLRIACQTPTLRYLIAVFSYSTFLSEAVLKNPHWLEQLAASGDMHRVLTVEEYEQRLHRFIGPDRTPSAVELARFRREQLLRIVIRDVLSLGTLSDVTEELSNLAGAILDLSYRRIRLALARGHGEPLVDGKPARFSVVALGKLGGRELNYSSDIDLLFIYEGIGDTAGPHTVSNKEFFKKLANDYTALLSTYTGEGMCYRVDLRLRPDGRFGEVCQSLEGALNYYRTRGRDWELQMLIKGRVAAGDREPGARLLESVEPLIYSTTLDFKAVESVSEARERINEKLKRSSSPGLDVKLTRGGIRDIEFLVQCLQRLHGGREPWVRQGGTLFALFRLRDKNLLSDSEYARLAAAYQFLRHIEHRLQFDEDRQTHLLPQGFDALDLLARKMPESQTGTVPSAGTLQRELDSHLEAVRELYDRVVRSQRSSYYFNPPPDDESDAAEPAMSSLGPGVSVPSPNLARYLEARAPQLAEAIARTAPHDGRLEYLIEKLAASPDFLEPLERDADLRACTLDVFNHSRYFADQLVRYPELLNEIAQACGDRQGRIGFRAPSDMTGLRRYFREQMTRIQADSIFHRAPIFKTLKRTSALAESVIRAAYDIAVDEAIETAPPASHHYHPAGQMMTIALGRLGMREFDLASDADLVFVIPDRDAAEWRFWTSVAERMIHVISAYTGDGVLFTVDTRLRPNGRDGGLVQTETNYKDYFARHAEAWEGIAYMKSRAVAGDIERGTRFLHDLQQVDWRRYGQNGRSRAELAQMRTRLEREQGAHNLLKAGPGGYYDIDFALMYLRLKGAGMFFPVLNTPERIDVIEKMGHLEREAAEFLLDAAVFYRAVDHGLRVLNGHAEGRLPANPSQAGILADLVSRWTPERLHGPLPATLKSIRRRTREFYSRIFEE